MSKEDGGNAFPVSDYDHMVFLPKDVSEHSRLLSGMSLLDYFAAKALQGFSANSDFTNNTASEVAEMAYVQARAMLAERTK